VKPRKGGRQRPTGQSKGEASPQPKYRIEIRPAAAEFISSLTGKDLRLVSEKIDALANYPVPPQAKRLSRQLPVPPDPGWQLPSHLQRG